MWQASMNRSPFVISKRHIMKKWPWLQLYKATVETNSLPLNKYVLHKWIESFPELAAWKKTIQEQGENVRGRESGPWVKYRLTGTSMKQLGLAFLGFSQFQQHGIGHRHSQIQERRYSQTWTPVHWPCGQTASPYSVFLSVKCNTNSLLYLYKALNKRARTQWVLNMCELFCFVF